MANRNVTIHPGHILILMPLMILIGHIALDYKAHVKFCVAFCAKVMDPLPAASRPPPPTAIIGKVDIYFSPKSRGSQRRAYMQATRIHRSQ